MGAWILIFGFLGICGYGAFINTRNAQKKIKSYDDIAEIKNELNRNNRKMKVCPACAEDILAAAIFCKHCKTSLI